MHWSITRSIINLRKISVYAIFLVNRNFVDKALITHLTKEYESYHAFQYLILKLLILHILKYVIHTNPIIIIEQRILNKLVCIICAISVRIQFDVHAVCK